MESWEGQGPDAVLRRTVRWPLASQAISGWLEVRWDRTQAVVHLRVSASLDPVLPQVVAQLRDWLDLDAEPARIAQVIGRDFPEALGQRLPGCLDGFELAVRAILGQQISVKAARTLGQRLVKNPVARGLQSPKKSPARKKSNVKCGRLLRNSKENLLKEKGRNIVVKKETVTAKNLRTKWRNLRPIANC